MKLSPENKIELSNRLKSFAWRAGGLLAAQVLDLVAQVAGLFDLPLWAVAVIGLLVGETTKLLRNKNLL